METLWSFNTENFKVTLDIQPDYDCDFSFDETGETEEKVNSGEWSCFQSRVSVYWQGNRVSEEWLCGSIYANPKDFIDHRGRNKAGHGSYFSDMVHAAIASARKYLSKAKHIHIRGE